MRELTRRQLPSMPISDELYKQLSIGNQVLTVVAESFGVEVKVSEYGERYFVNSETCEEIYSQIEALQNEEEPNKKAEVQA